MGGRNIILPVMGAYGGAGKSTFVDTLLQEDKMRIIHELSPSTNVPLDVPFSISNQLGVQYNVTLWLVVILGIPEVGLLTLGCAWSQISVPSIIVKGTKTIKRLDKLKDDDMIIVFEDTYFAFLTTSWDRTGLIKAMWDDIPPSDASFLTNLHLIDTTTGQPDKRANIGLRSATSTANAVRIETDDVFRNDRPVLVDTPSFDDTLKTDFEILEIIRKFLVKTYSKHVKITGLVYLHHIADNRIAETLHRRFHVFTKICGENAVKNVALVTIMWDEIDEEIGQEREEEVENKLWGTMKDAHHLRFDNLSILRGRSSRSSQSTSIQSIIPYSLQTEIVEEKMNLLQTKAAQALFTPLNAMLAEQDSLSHQNVERESAEAKANALLNETIANQAAIDALLTEFHIKPSPFGRKVSNQVITIGKIFWGRITAPRGPATSSR